MKRIIRLTETELIKLVKKVISEQSTSNCPKPADWLLDYKIDGKLGKQSCSEWRWDKNTNEFLAILLKNQIVASSISVDDIDETEAEQIAKLFKMRTYQLKNFEKNYYFKMDYSSTEPGGDLNRLLDSLQGKLPFINFVK